MKKWIYQSNNWPCFSWDNNALASKLAAVRYQQGLLLGKIANIGVNLKNNANINILTSDIVKSSAIEGEVLNPDEVRSSVTRQLGIDTAGIMPVSRHIDGFVELMLDATQNYQQPLTKERLCAWQATLFPTGRSGMQFIVVGAWRNDNSGPMQVISGPFGRTKVHYQAPAAGQLEQQMQLFLNWFNTSCEQQNNLDPVLKSGIAHFWFVTIHPFEDGNGRIARAIADMALTRADGIGNRYYSMSTQIAAERKVYYDKLMQQQRSSTDLTPWLDWYLDCMMRALDNSEKVLAKVYYKEKLWQQLSQYSANERQRLVINRLLEDFKGFITTSKYAKLAKCSNDTALRDIQDLNQKGVLIKNRAGGRSTSYRLPVADKIQ